MPAPNHGKTSLKPEDEWQSTKQNLMQYLVSPGHCQFWLGQGLSLELLPLLGICCLGNGIWMGIRLALCKSHQTKGNTELLPG